jgi:hypothetical protein
VTTKLVVENLKNKPMRSLLSFLLIGVPVTLILTLEGLSTGMLHDAQDRARGVGADILVRASSTTTAVGASADSVTTRFRMSSWPWASSITPSTFRCSLPGSTRRSSIP